MVLEEDDAARRWRDFRYWRRARSVARASLKFGLPLGIAAIFGVSRIVSGFELGTYAAVVLIGIASLPASFALMAHMSSKLTNQWELSERGIRMTGDDRGRIRWQRIERIDFGSIDELPGYTEVSLRGKPLLGFIAPKRAALILRGSEEVVREMVGGNRTIGT